MSDNPVAMRLKEARINAGLSQKELGIRAGIDEFSASPRINQYEKGKHVPDYSTLERLGEVLGAPVAYFYCEDSVLAEIVFKQTCIISMMNNIIFESCFNSGNTHHISVF